MIRNTTTAMLLSMAMALPASAQDAYTGATALEQYNAAPTKKKFKKKRSKSKIYEYKTETSNGEEFSFADHRGEVMLIVNTASKCGFTPQFEGLERIYKAHKDEGLTIVGFPSGDFANQELEDGAKAAEFCQQNYGVTFTIMKKVHVNGEEEEPVFAYLKSQQGFAGWNEQHPIYPILHKRLKKADADYEQKPSIKWNFTKFLVARDGTVVKRYEPTADMDEMEADIVKELGK